MTEVRIHSGKRTLRYNQNHDEHGKFAVGSGAALGKYAASVRAFRAEGGEVNRIEDGEHATAKLEEVHQLAAIIGVDPRTGIDQVGATSDERDAMGVRFTEYALNDAWMGFQPPSGMQAMQDGEPVPELENRTTFVAEAEGLGVTGAISLWDQPPMMSDDGLEPVQAVYIDYLGTMGVVDGTGSALVQQAAEYASSRGLGLVGNPTPDAAPWWHEQIGFHEDPFQAGWAMDGLTPEETTALAKAGR